MDAETVDVETMFKDIQNICKMAVLKNPNKRHTGDLLAVIDECRSFLRLYDIRRQNPSLEERFCEGYFEEEEDTLSVAIKKAYHSAVLFEDSVHGEELYFLKGKQSVLLDWKPDVSPYSELQNTRLKFFARQDIRLADFVFLFEELCKVLREDISEELLLEKIRSIFQRMKMKCLKYIGKSPRQY